MKETLLFADLDLTHAVFGPNGIIGVVKWKWGMYTFLVWNEKCTELRGESSVFDPRSLAATPREFCVLDRWGTVTMFNTRGCLRRRWSSHSPLPCAMTAVDNWVYVVGGDDIGNRTVHVYDARNGHQQHSFVLESRFRFLNSMTIIADELFLLQHEFRRWHVCVFSIMDGALLREWECGDWASNVTCSASGHLWLQMPTEFTCFRPDGTQCDPYPQRLHHEAPTVVLSWRHEGLFKLQLY